MAPALLPLLEAAVVLLALAVALLLRPWRALRPDDAPWPWLAWWVLLPLLWSADRLVQIPLAQPLSGAVLLMLMAGWPLAALALLPVTAATVWLADISMAEGLHRLVWLGLVPMTVALMLGAAMRRWLPHHVFVYMLGRGFFTPLLAGSVAAALLTWLMPSPLQISRGELMLGRWLAAWGDAWLCGFVVAIFVAFRPRWLATYSDAIYLRPRA